MPRPPTPEAESSSNQDRARDMTRRQAYAVEILKGMLSRNPPPRANEMVEWARTAWKWADVLIRTEPPESS